MINKYKNKIIAAFAVSLLLLITFFYGGVTPGKNQKNTILPTQSPPVTESTTDAPHITTEDGIPLSSATSTVPLESTTVPTVESSSNSKNSTGDASAKAKDAPATIDNKPQKPDNSSMSAEKKIALAQRMADSSTNQSETESSASSETASIQSSDEAKSISDVAPNDVPLPIDPENTVISDKELYCTLSVRCDTILNNLAWLDPEKVELVPSDGIILAEQTVKFYDGESVFNLLLREMKRNKIHMEFENTPIYNSSYIEGIANLYEFDCGELSGWMYRVNGLFPNYGCSRYRLKEGDKVEWVYTCDLGTDVGGNYSTENRK